MVNTSSQKLWHKFFPSASDKKQKGRKMIEEEAPK